MSDDRDDTTAPTEDDELWERALGDAYAPVPEPAEPRDSTPSRPGRYRYLAEIARGGMGVVHRARDERLGRDVAIKVLRTDHMNNPALIARFLEEAQISGQIQHPGIVPIHEVGLDAAERPFICMELVRGRTLALLLAERRDPAFDRTRILGVFEQVCQTLAFAHSRGVVHRDLKPGNVMVGEFGEIRVVDWGFAKVLGGAATPVVPWPSPELAPPESIETLRTGSDSSQSIPGSVLGTPGYMPPEQARGEVELLDERADVFALGSILCEILTGRPAFTGDDRRVALEATKAGGLGTAYERLAASGADSGLIALARRCLDPERDQRPRDAGELVVVLAEHRVRAEERTRLAQVEAAEARGRAAEEHRARRRTLVMSVIVVVSLALATAVFLWRETERHRESDEADAIVHGLVADSERELGAGNLVRASELLLAAKGALTASPVSERGGADVLRLARHLESARSAVAAKDASRARAAALRSKLEALWASGAGEREDVLREYAAIFRSEGLDPDGQEPVEVARRLMEIAEPLRGSLIAALDDWSARAINLVALDPPRADGRGRNPSDLGPGGGRTPTPRLRPESGGEATLRHAGQDPLLRILKLADPDPWRNALRDAVLRDDRDGLQALATALKPGEQGPRSLDLLALSLVRLDRRDQALTVLRKAVVAHANDFWLHYHLAVFGDEDVGGSGERGGGGRDGPGHDHLESLAHAWAAVSLDPTAGFARDYLANVLMHAGRAEEAIDVLRQGSRALPDDPNVSASLVRELLSRDDVAGANEVARERLKPVAGETSGSAPLLECVRIALRTVDVTDRWRRASLWLAGGFFAARPEVARLSWASGRHDEVLRLAEDAQASDAADVETQLVRVASEIALGRYAPAREHASALSAIGSALAQPREAEAEALEHAAHALDRREGVTAPGDLLLRARVLGHRGQYQDAAAILLDLAGRGERLVEEAPRADRNESRRGARPVNLEGATRDLAAILTCFAAAKGEPGAPDDATRHRAAVVALEILKTATRRSGGGGFGPREDSEAWLLDQRFAAVRDGGTDSHLAEEDAKAFKDAFAALRRQRSGEQRRGPQRPPR